MVALVAAPEHLYFYHEAPLDLAQVDGHLTVDPSPEVYGRHLSETIPVLARYFQAVPRFPPLHPMFNESHSTISSGERTTSILPDEAIQNLSERVSEAAKAQHEPHDY